LGLLFLIAFNGWLLTKRDVAADYLGHAVARFAEVDRLMAQGFDGMRETARTDPESTVRLPGFPVEVEIPGSLVAERSENDVRAALLSSSGKLIYDEGDAAFVADGSQVSDGDNLSAGRILRRVLLLVNEDTHLLFAVASVVLGLAAGLAAANIWRRRDEPVALVIIGMAVVASAVTAMVIALIVRLISRLVADVQTEYLAVELLMLVGDTSTLVLRTGSVFLVAGALIALAGWYIGSASSEPRRS
jgi:hypothetical protein